jgi:hypothetical protein
MPKEPAVLPAHAVRTRPLSAHGGPAVDSDLRSGDVLGAALAAGALRHLVVRRAGHIGSYGRGRPCWRQPRSFRRPDVPCGGSDRLP